VTSPSIVEGEVPPSTLGKHGQRFHSRSAGDVPLGSYRHLRIRPRAGAPRGVRRGENGAGMYVVLGQAATPLRQEWADVTFDIGAGTYQSTMSATTVIWDNVNTP